MIPHPIRQVGFGLAAGLVAASAAWAQIPADLDLVEVTNLSEVVAIRNAGDGSDRLFLVRQPGEIYIYEVDTDTLLPNPFLDIQSKVDDVGNEQGLLGLAFHPDFASNGFFYVNYTRDPGPGLDRTVIERYTATGDTADPMSGVTLIEIEQDFSNHNGGDIHFGPDGHLYIGMGDGGSGGDPNNRSQDPAQLLGKMLRIDVDPPPPTPGRGGGLTCGLAGSYTIPPDNPFAGNANTCNEIWALGLRNPWRFSFDRVTGDLFIGDVGQGPSSPLEEIDFEPAGSGGGRNYGWRCYQASAPFNLGGCGPIGNYTFPILEYDHSNSNCSVTGGFRYRGAIAGLNGIYIYADYCSGRIFFAEEAGGGSWSSSLWRDTSFGITTFGEDEDGELYVAYQGGSIQRFTSAEISIVFLDGFESGNTNNWSNVVVD